MDKTRDEFLLYKEVGKAKIAKMRETLRIIKRTPIKKIMESPLDCETQTHTQLEGVLQIGSKRLDSFTAY